MMNIIVQNFKQYKSNTCGIEMDDLGTGLYMQALIIKNMQRRERNKDTCMKKNIFLGIYNLTPCSYK